ALSTTHARGVHPCDHGRTVVRTEKASSVNGLTRAPFIAEMMHASAGVPCAGPLTTTSRTRPSGPNTTVAFEGENCPATHARARHRTLPTTPWAAPIDGLSACPLERAAGTRRGSAGRAGLGGASARWASTACVDAAVSGAGGRGFWRT